MADATDIHGVVFKNGSATLLARVVGVNGAPISSTQITSAEYSIYLLDENDPDLQTPISGHQGVSIPVVSLVFDNLQTDDLWDIDDVGYNVKHTLDVASLPAFAIAGRNYRIVFELTPTAGQVILVRFRVHAI